MKAHRGLKIIRKENNMCKYCGESQYQNEYGRQFGKEFEKELSYSGEVCVSWLIKNGNKTSYELYMTDNEFYCDISVPIQFCPKCGRKFE